MKIKDMPRLHPSDDAIAISTHLRLGMIGIAATIFLVSSGLIGAIGFHASTTIGTVEPGSDTEVRIMFWGGWTFAFAMLFALWGIIGMAVYTRTYRQLDAVALEQMKRRKEGEDPSNAQRGERDGGESTAAG